MNIGTPVIFLREKVIHSKNPAITPHEITLEEVPAIYLGESPNDDVCAVCHEPRERHARRGRIHSYTPWAPEVCGAEIEVHYPDPNDGVEIRHHVLEGNSVNCWTVKPEGE